MKRLIGLALCAPVLVSAAALAYDGGGAGMNNCSELTRLYDQGTPDVRAELMLGTSQWGLGYMTGINASLPQSQRRDLSGFLDGSLGEEVLTVCYQFPNELIISVVEALYSEAPPYQPGMS